MLNRMLMGVLVLVTLLCAACGAPAGTLPGHRPPAGDAGQEPTDAGVDATDPADASAPPDAAADAPDAQPPDAGPPADCRTTGCPANQHCVTPPLPGAPSACECNTQPANVCTGSTCGTMPDGCGGTIDCGTWACGQYETCQGNACTCEPQLECAATATRPAYNCGPVTACGQQASCGTCVAGEQCWGNNCLSCQHMPSEDVNCSGTNHYFWLCDSIPTPACTPAPFSGVQAWCCPNSF